MSNLIKRLIVISAALVPAFAAVQAHAGTVKFVTGNGSNQWVCGYVYFNGGAQNKSVALAPHSPVREVLRFTKPNGTAFSTQFSGNCYGQALPVKHHRVRGNMIMKGF